MQNSESSPIFNVCLFVSFWLRETDFALKYFFLLEFGINRNFACLSVEMKSESVAATICMQLTYAVEQVHALRNRTAMTQYHQHCNLMHRTQHMLLHPIRRS